MKKRLMVGIMAGGLMAAMLPGVASAEDRLGQCIKKGTIGTNAEGGSVHVGKNGGGWWVLPPGTEKGILSAQAKGGNGPAW